MVIAYIATAARLVLGEYKSEKIMRIREITSGGKVVDIKLLRHGLDEEKALEIETVAFNLPKSNPAGIMRGHHSHERGLITLKDIELKYQAEDAILKKNMMLIKVSTHSTVDITTEILSYCTNSAWRINQENASRVQVACAIYRGITREEHTLESWNQHKDQNNRWEFTGHDAESSVCDSTIDRSIKYLIDKSEQKPFRYVWSKDE